MECPTCGRAMVATNVARKEQPHIPCIPALLCAHCNTWQPRQDPEEAFLEESLEATTMHEPPPYPSDRLEWVGTLQTDGIDD
jgi:hypothetical protein